jgi:hypothetical protein
VTPGPVYRFLNGSDFPSLSNIGRFSIFFSVAWVGRSLFVFTSPSNSIVLSMLSRFSSECLCGDVSFVSMCGFDGVLFSCDMSALADGGSDEMDMLASHTSVRLGSLTRQKIDRVVGWFLARLDSTGEAQDALLSGRWNRTMALDDGNGDGNLTERTFSQMLVVCAAPPI